VPVVQLEVVELRDDLLAGLSGEELGVFEHWRIDLFKAKEPGRGAEMLVEPRPEPEVLGVEVASAAWSLQAVLGHGVQVTHWGRRVAPAGSEIRARSSVCRPMSCYPSIPTRTPEDP